MPGRRTESQGERGMRLAVGLARDAVVLEDGGEALLEDRRAHGVLGGRHSLAQIGEVRVVRGRLGQRLW